MTPTLTFDPSFSRSPLRRVLFHRALRLLGALALAVLAAGFLAAAACPIAAQAQGLDYPDTKTVDTVDVYHGIRVPDPYRWLEDHTSAATRQWVEQQNALTFGYLEQIPEREPLGKRLRTLWNYPKYGIPEREAGRRFFSKNEGLQDQPVMYVRPYVRPTEEGAEPRMLFNPNAWSEDGTVSLSAFAPGPNGRYVAYGKSEDGSDWKTLYVRNLETGQDLRDTIDWVKFSEPTWIQDGKGFYYGRYPAPQEGRSMRRSRRG